MSDLFYSQELSMQCQGDLTNIYSSGALRSYAQEHQPLDEMLNYIKLVTEDMQKTEKQILLRKEELFKKADFK